MGVAGGRKPPPVDLIDARYEFARVFGREPRSWRDYVYGLRHIARHEARWRLRIAGGVSGALQDKEHLQQWHDDWNARAGW